jgi:hypothetical protein
MKVTATVITPGSAEEMIFARGDTSGNPGNGYYVYIRGGTTIRDLRREDSGSFTSLQSTSWPSNPATNDTYAIEVSGTGATVTVKTYKNGSQVGATYSDTNANRKTSGNYAGFHAIFNSSVWDDFTVDDLSAGGSTTPVTSTATAVGVATVQKTVIKAEMAAVAVGVATVTEQLVQLKNVVATAIGIATVQKQINKPVDATAIGLATLQKQVNKNIDAVAVGVPSLQRQLNKNISATAIGVATVSTQQVRLMTIAATAIGIATVVVNPVWTRNVVAVAVGVATMTKSFIAGTGIVTMVQGLTTGLSRWLKI